MSNNKTLDSLYALRFLKTLIKDWTDLPAYKSGVINNKGTVIVPKLKQSEKQKESYTRFDVLIWNLKRLLEKFPLGRTTMARYTTAIRLIKEEARLPAEDTSLEEAICEILKITKSQLFEMETSSCDGNSGMLGLSSPKTGETGHSSFKNYVKKKRKRKDD